MTFNLEVSLKVYTKTNSAEAADVAEDFALNLLKPGRLFDVDDYEAMITEASLNTHDVERSPDATEDDVEVLVEKE